MSGPNDVLSVLSAALTLIRLVPEAKNTIESIVDKWCCDRGIDPAPVLTRLRDDLDQKIQTVDAAIDAQLNKLPK